MPRLPELDELIRYVERRSSADPLERIRVAMKIGADLTATGDDLVNHYITEARDSGLSWTDIGSSLGVTKQAAQQRFVPRDDAPTFSNLRRARPYRMLTSRARRTFRFAIEACRSEGHRAVDTEHLLLGLLDVGDGVGPEVLAGVQPLPQWRQAVVAAMSGGGVRPRGRMLLTPLARQVVDRSCAVASRLGHDYIGTEHQLIALAEVTDGVAAKVLAAGGCDAAGLTDAVLARLGEPPARPSTSENDGAGEDPGPTQPA
jgi:hypothetical protein